ncbi:MAG: CDC48 family AAA ATPase [Candidatus Woesearchaeota archaeon]
MSDVVKLKVAEAIQDDVNRGIIRIDSTFMHELDVRPEDVVEIKGERTTLGIVERAYPGDIGLNIIRMDGLVRRNARSGIGEFVEIKKADVSEAKKVVVSPTNKDVKIDASPKIFKRGLQGRPVLHGDIVSLSSPRRKKQNSYKPFFDDLMDMDSMMSFGLGDIKFLISEANPKQAVVITENTEIVYNPEPQNVQEEKSLEVTYEDIGGLSEEVTKVREMVELPLKHPELFERLGIDPPKGVLLHGAPGTGKTLLAKAVANETQANFILINGPEIMSKYYGQSEQNLRKKFEEAEKSAPSIIFIDEIDAIAVKREDSHGEVERRVVAQMLALMDGLKSRGKVVVIAASNIPNSLDPALRRPGRFDREIEIGVPDRNSRENIMRIHTRNMPFSEDVDLDSIADYTHGFVGADLYALSKEAAMNVLRRILPDINTSSDSEKVPNEILEKLYITAEDFKEARKVVQPSAMREVLVELPSVRWEDIGGMDNLKQELIEAVEWPIKHPGSFSRLGVKPPRGVLIYGPPGTGKTLLAKAVATESNANFISVKGPELLSKWVNETPQLVKKLFSKAKQVAPSIVFIDEIDSIASLRDNGGDSDKGMSAINQLLTEMDGLEALNDVVVIAATNRPDVLDPAILRAGRCDRMVMSSVPDQETRKDIFKIHTRNMPLADDVSLEELSVMTEGYVGADIEVICREAAILALRENIDTHVVLNKHFESAMQKVKGSVSKEIIEMYDKFESEYKLARGKAVNKKENYFG